VICIRYFTHNDHPVLIITIHPSFLPCLFLCQVRRERGLVDPATNLPTNPVVRYHGGLGDRMVEAGRLGHKTLKGWYNYDPKQQQQQKDAKYYNGGMKTADPETVALLTEHRKSLGIVVRPRAEISRQEIEERCLFGLVNEVSLKGYFWCLVFVLLESLLLRILLL